jgi:hypothetical protein
LGKKKKKVIADSSMCTKNTKGMSNLPCKAMAHSPQVSNSYMVAATLGNEIKMYEQWNGTRQGQA